MSLADQPVFLALCASFFFGLALVLTQFGLRTMRPGEGVLISIPMLTAAAWLIAIFQLDLAGWNSEAAAIFLAVGLAYPALVTMLTYEANRTMGPGVAGALGNLAPLFAVSGAALLFGDWPRPLQIVGIIAIVGGVALLSVRGFEATGRHWSWWAAALPLGASIIRGIAQPVTKVGLASWPSPFAALLFGFTASTVVVAGAALARNRGLPRGFSRPGILWFCCVGLCNGLAVLTLYAALARGSVVLVAPLAATYPLVTLALTALLLRSERITAGLVAGIAVTVVGVALLFGR
jgi:drug/metabolite transporter (DMT)-like permease